ncbi:hypothetical protein ETAA1_01600 [Urbifossiella limnaea]|uniref:Uncharacterized protein n=1 Tax=Urbifossiella limnaea TaxID=2528023 RepID=A0A517XL92_9BACT|nr:hypothetical protein ETAA1_01600 [Urbifossiella limnaea]
MRKNTVLLTLCLLISGIAGSVVSASLQLHAGIGNTLSMLIGMPITIIVFVLIVFVLSKFGY